jgi:hypothetical protein
MNENNSFRNLSLEKRNHLLEMSIINNAHKRGWSKYLTAQAFQEGILTVKLGPSDEEDSNTYVISFAEGFGSEYLLRPSPSLFDFRFEANLKSQSDS